MASAMRLASVNNSSMSRALRVSEIFSNVISYINTDSRYPNRRMRLRYATYSGRDLFALALTCHAFSEQALDALWETMRGLIPFLRCAGIIAAPTDSDPPTRDEDEDKDYCPSIVSFFFLPK